MAELSLEALAKRIEALEKELAEPRAPQADKKDWRRAIGMFEDTEFSRQVDAEGQAIREAERREARGGAAE